MHDDTILAGTVLSFTGSPFDDAPDRAAQLHEAVLIRAGRIHALGPLDTLTAQAPEATITRHEGCLISPGFIDAHAHYPQTAIIASWGKRLIDWLNGYTFPEEMRFGDPAYATEIANRYLDLTLANGTTTTISYCSSSWHTGRNIQWN